MVTISHNHSVLLRNWFLKISQFCFFRCNNSSCFPTHIHLNGSLFLDSIQFSQSLSVLCCCNGCLKWQLIQLLYYLHWKIILLPKYIIHILQIPHPLFLFPIQHYTACNIWPYSMSHSKSHSAIHYKIVPLGPFQITVWEREAAEEGFYC